MAESTYRRVKADPTSCISPAAGIVGDVELRAHSSVFAGAQLRGDCGQRIVVGERSNVQEGAVLHVGHENPCIVGDDVTVGHGAIVHGCTLEDNVLVGMGAVVLDGARIRRNSLVGGQRAHGLGRAAEDEAVLGKLLAPGYEGPGADEVERLISSGAREYVSVSEEMVAEGMMFHPDGAFCGQTGA